MVDEESAGKVKLNIHKKIIGEERRESWRWSLMSAAEWRCARIVPPFCGETSRTFVILREEEIDGTWVLVCVCVCMWLPKVPSPK